MHPFHTENHNQWLYRHSHYFRAAFHLPILQVHVPQANLNEEIENNLKNTLIITS